VNQTVQDRIAQGWVREADVPIGHRYLSRDQSGALAIAVIQDFEEVLRLGPAQRVAEPIIGPNSRPKTRS